MRINNNATANNAARIVSRTNESIARNVERLSTGYRINRAGDDASGLVISNQLRGQVSGLRQAIRNAQDGVSVLQTAEGALEQVSSMLNRMRDLAVQAANSGTNGVAARDAGQAEVVALASEITRIAGQTKFGSLNLLDGTFGITPARTTGFDADDSITTTAGDTFTLDIAGSGPVTVAVPTFAGAAADEVAPALEAAIRSALASGNADQQALAAKVNVTAASIGAGAALTIEVRGLQAGDSFTLANGTGTPLAALGLTGPVEAAVGDGGRFQVGANADEQIVLTFQNFSSEQLGVSGITFDSDANVAAALNALDGAIDTVSVKRGDIGALQNRFESLIQNLSVTTENLAASESRIRDTDMATEMVEFTKNQVLSQAGTAMLAQANTIPEGILALLRG